MIPFLREGRLAMLFVEAEKVLHTHCSPWQRLSTIPTPIQEPPTIIHR